jgi:hypothetical protein
MNDEGFMAAAYTTGRGVPQSSWGQRRGTFSLGPRCHPLGLTGQEWA